MLKNKNQIMNFEILLSDVLIKKFILKSPEGITRTLARCNGRWELVDIEGTPPLKHVPWIYKVCKVLCYKSQLLLLYLHHVG